MIARDSVEGGTRGAKIIGAWLLLAALAGMVAYQIYNTVLLIGLLVVNQPTVRPPGWSMQTLTPLGRLTVLVLGLLWLGFVTGVEGYLRDWHDESVLGARVQRISIVFCIVYVALDAIFLIV